MLRNCLNASGSFINFLDSCTFPCMLVRCISIARLDLMLIEVVWCVRGAATVDPCLILRLWIS